MKKKVILKMPNKIKIIFMGTPQIAVSILETLYKSPNFEVVLVVTEPDKPAGHNTFPVASPVKKFALSNNLKILQPIKIIEIKKELTASGAKIALVTAYGQIIPAEILNIFKYGILNVHFSLLPKYRGASPIQYALLNGDKITGTTLMVMDEKMDTGKILAQKELKIEPDDDFEILSQKLTKISSEILEQNILDYINGKLKPASQDNSKATYTKLLKKENGLIDWTKKASEIANQIRAFSVWPKSYTYLNNKRIIIKKAQSSTTELEMPSASGTVFIEKKSHKIAVQCGMGSLIIDVLQLEGKKEMSSRDFLNGHQEIIGEVLKKI
jgi:methionyl-tRNA formyltransferase